jgi:ADP-ribose pyrophosphatase YjhB (NUDIX family)
VKRLKIVYNRKQPPSFFNKSIFLAGPTPRDSNLKSWRSDAIEILDSLGYDGVVFVPEDSPNDPDLTFPDYDTDPVGYKEQIDWETTWLNAADCIIFWIPRQLPDFLGLTTNVEFGRFFKSGKVFVGAPKEAVKNEYLKVISEQNDLNWYDDLSTCIRGALDSINIGSVRTGTERYVPLQLWQHDTFKNWRDTLTTNDLDCSIDYTLLDYVYIPKISKKLFFWLIQTDINIGAEQRHKTNEFVIGRTDLSTLVVRTTNPNFRDIRLVLIKEFRSPGRNKSGYVYEVPSGSVSIGEGDLEHAAKELEEETGISFSTLDTAQFINSRQCAATFSAHNNRVYCITISDETMNKIQEETSGKSFGLESDTERTYVEIQTVGQILDNNLVDWTMLGIIFETIFK